MENFGVFLGHLVILVPLWYTYFMATWYFCVRFGILFPILVCCTEKNLATLVPFIPT
jgi:hypothetical protein